MTQKTKYIPKSLKVVLVYVLAILLEFTIVNAYLASAITISSGVYPSAASYTLWKEGSTYFAKDAFGFIPSWAESSNASQIFNSAGQITGKIFIKAGTYILTNWWILGLNDTSSIGDNLWIEGEGNATVLYLDNAVNLPVIFAREKTGITIRNLKIDGNKVGQTGGGGVSGIRFRGCTNFFLENLYIVNTYHQGIDLVDMSGITPCSNGFIHNIRTYRTGAAGIYLGAQAHDISIDTAHLYQAGKGAGGGGIDSDGLIIAGEEMGYTENILLTNIWAIDNSRYGISIWDTENLKANNIVANENDFTGIMVLQSSRLIEITNFQANNNSWRGIQIHNTASLWRDDIDNHYIRLQGLAYGNAWSGVELSGNLPSTLGNYPSDIDISVDAIENGYHGIYICAYNSSYVVSDVTIHDCLIYNNSKNVSNTYDGIYFYVGLRLQISNVHVSGSSHRWGLYDDGGSLNGYNLISDSHFLAGTTGGIKIAADSNTHVTNSFNGTTFIASYP